MTREEAAEKLKEIFRLVVHNGVNTDLLTEESDIRNDLGVDSIGMIYMAIAIEQTFDVDLSNASVNTFKTVGDVITFICEQKR
ncbi:MAG: acyl carrier protein [Clostridia bacterium]|nr:acyl carrier protein [Clostridia bacterium]